MALHRVLHVVRGGATTTQLLPERGTLTIGRGAHNDVDIDDPSVSRRHALLHVGTSLSVEDLGSRNGTRVRRLAESEPLENEDTAELSEPHTPSTALRFESGDVVSVGSVTLIVRPGASGVYAAMRVPVLLDPEMRRIHRTTERLAESSVTVLYLGETGVGKEVLAETLHRLSPRRSRPFLRLNCGALPEALLESHLFGHERGAFTGATQSKPGLLEVASGGTVLLDEVGELPLAVQVKLLRVLEERQVLRIGGLKPRPIDVRFVAATNRDLERDIVRGAFREDLYYRLSAVVLTIPPLRERPSEIEPLARAFIHDFCIERGRPEPALEPRALALLAGYAWPGNLRELKNVIVRALLLLDGDRIGVEHLPAAKLASVSAGCAQGATELPASVARELDSPLPTGPLSGASASDDPADRVLADLENKLGQAQRERVIRALEQCAGNQTQAAKLLGISRRTLVTRLETYRLPRPRKRADDGSARPEPAHPASACASGTRA